MLSPASYFVFSIIWLSFGIYAGYVIPASDAGDIADSKKMTLHGIVLCGGAIALFTIFQFVFDNGIVHWTIISAQKWPLLSAVISVLLAIFGFKH